MTIPAISPSASPSGAPGAGAAALRPIYGVRAGYCIPRPETHAKARELFQRYPKAAYMTEIEFSQRRPDGQIEFVVRRLPTAD